METGENSDKEPKNIRRKKGRFFETYILKILKSRDLSVEKYGITANAKQQLSSVLCILAKNFSQKVLDMTQISDKKTISIKEVQNTCKILFPKKLSEECIDFAEKSVENFCDETRGPYGPHGPRGPHGKINITKQERAGIIFPPSLIEKFMRNFGLWKIMITKSAPVFFSACLEHVCVIILSFSIENAVKENHIRLTIRDLELAIQNNQDLRNLFLCCNMNFMGGGIVPEINVFLLNKIGRTNKSKKSRLQEETRETEIFPSEKIGNVVSFLRNSKHPEEKKNSSFSPRYSIFERNQKTSETK